ncbi:MAG: hypothetical protein CM1200mP41_19000 [Gammaproteobacteria bacterium]|nr:MAG: hypothetical protein CM1200mP41_19000 [Gammaproteobacteria bacterium]
MQDYFTSIGEKPLLGDQILQWVYHHRVTRFKGYDQPQQNTEGVVGPDSGASVS